MFGLAAGVPPAVEPGILPGGYWRGLRRQFLVQSCQSGRQDATLYGSQDGRRYNRKVTKGINPNLRRRERFFLGCKRRNGELSHPIKTMSNLRQSRGLEIVNAQSHLALRALAVPQGQDVRASRCGGFFPLTPTLSPGERVNHSLRGEQSRAVGFPLRDARCSLSLRERVRVRGNGVNYHPAYQPIPGTLELRESSGRAGGFPG